MSEFDAAILEKTAVVIPALNEAEGLRELLPALMRLGLRQVIVADNGSTDGTAGVIRDSGATYVSAPTRGYGSACFAGMQRLDSAVEIVVFLDADLSDDCSRLPDLVEPIAAGEADLVLGSRVCGLREAGAMSLPQRFGNALATRLIRWGWGHRYHDLGPFRAVRREALERIDMRDRAFGWTVEMQIRAVEERLRVRERPVAYRRRRGRSKISGTVRGVLGAARGILGTCARLWLARQAQLRRRA